MRIRVANSGECWLDVGGVAYRPARTRVAGALVVADRPARPERQRGEERHGTAWAYAVLGCRCAPCIDARTLAALHGRERRAARRNAQVRP